MKMDGNRKCSDVGRRNNAVSWGGSVFPDEKFYDDTPLMIFKYLKYFDIL
jgi:hypothetical protein